MEIRDQSSAKLSSSCLSRIIGSGEWDSFCISMSFADKRVLGRNTKYRRVVLFLSSTIKAPAALRVRVYSTHIKYEVFER